MVTGAARDHQRPDHTQLRRIRHTAKGEVGDPDGRLVLAGSSAKSAREAGPQPADHRRSKG
eukprot:11486629-Heterocapsa_arctica.AAC.1